VVLVSGTESNETYTDDVFGDIIVRDGGRSSGERVVDKHLVRECVNSLDVISWQLNDMLVESIRHLKLAIIGHRE
jgi:hypothetical protein